MQSTQEDKEPEANSITHLFKASSIKRLQTSLPPPYLLIPVILSVTIMLLPLVYLVIRTIEASNNAWGILFSITSLQTLTRSLILMFTVTLLSLIIALPLAWLTARSNLPMKKTWTILAILPLGIPSFIGAFLFNSVFSPRGLFQNLLEGPFGIERLPDLDGLFGSTLVLTLLSYPYLFLTIRGYINNIDPSIEESARALGHRPISVFKKITLPQLKPAIIAGCLLVSLYTLSDFGAVSLMRYNTFTWTIYQQFGSVVDRSASATLSLALVLTAIIILMFEQNIRGKEKYHRVGSGASRKYNIVDLKFWKYPSIAGFGIVISMSLILPVTILLFWLFRGLSHGEPFIFLLNATINSVVISIITAFITVILSLCMGLILVRYPTKFNNLLESVSYTGYVLPGVVIGISMVFFGANYLPYLYQTVLILILAYIILFFPVALGTIRSSIIQIDYKIEDSARGLRHSYWSVLNKVTIPLLKSSLVMSTAMVFLLTIKELPATLILGPLNFKTLAIQVWSASSEGFFAQAAAPALTILIVSLLPLYLLILNDNRINIK